MCKKRQEKQRDKFEEITWDVFCYKYMCKIANLEKKEKEIAVIPSIMVNPPRSSEIINVHVCLYVYTYVLLFVSRIFPSPYYILHKYICTHIYIHECLL